MADSKTASAEAASPVILVAVAWPYANGPLHVGHVAGSLLAPDVFARYHRMRGRRVLMVSGSDMHGTPITVAADREGVEPAEIARRYHEVHRKGLELFDIHFDLFTSTATANHRAVTQDIFLTLFRAGYIELRTVTAPFDTKALRFLPDRYVEGQCPHCSSPDARGDQCDNCGRTLDPEDLLNPRSKLTGTKPEFRETQHYFLLLSKLEPALRAWVAQQAERAGWRQTVSSFTEGWLQAGLKDRAITRDLSYGIEIPAELGPHPDKRIYVWFEAVIGYLSASIEWAGRHEKPDAWRAFWNDDTARAYYFLGKDNIPFHTIIWPAMIHAYSSAGGSFGRLSMPWDVPANEFLQFGAEKFSKSRGIVLNAIELAQEFQADALRYYLVANMPERSDSNWSWGEFVSKVNDELLAKIGNYANRVLVLCSKNWDGIPPGDGAEDGDEAARSLAEACDAALATEAAFLDHCEFRKGLNQMVALATEGNRALDTAAPWSLVKQGESGKAAAAKSLRAHLRVIRALAIGLHPFMPALSESLWEQLGDAKGDHSTLRQFSEAVHEGIDIWRVGGPVPASGKLGSIKALVQKLDRDAVLARSQTP